MEGLERRVGLLEKLLEPPQLHVIDIDHAMLLADRFGAKRQAIELYQQQTGHAVKPGELVVYIVRNIITPTDGVAEWN